MSYFTILTKNNIRLIRYVYDELNTKKIVFGFRFLIHNFFRILNYVEALNTAHSFKCKK